jgi:hypothetical protein
MLMQMHFKFSLLDDESDFTPYRLIILPDNVNLTEALIQKLEHYLNTGGKLLASAGSGLNAKGVFVLPGLQLEALGARQYEPYYVYPCEGLLDLMPDFDYVIYKLKESAIAVRLLADDYKILLRSAEPYFNRTWEHFCSHVQTPVACRTDQPEMIYNNRNAIYIAPRIFDAYSKHAYWPYRKMVQGALDILLGERLVEADLPTTAEVTLRKNNDHRWVLNILNYVPQRRAPDLEIVEDVLPLSNIKVSVKTGDGVSRVFSPNDAEEFAFTRRNGRVYFTIPRIYGYRMIVME